MSPVRTPTKSPSIPLYLVGQKECAAWLKRQPKPWQSWLALYGFDGKGSAYVLVPDAGGNLAAVVVAAGAGAHMWSLADLPLKLPKAKYHLATPLNAAKATDVSIGWHLGCYQFSRYKKPADIKATFTLPTDADKALVKHMVDAVTLARDLINTPPNDMHTSALAAEAAAVAKRYGAKVNIIVGEQLLKKNYPAIYAVGKASVHPPQLVDVVWGNPKYKKVTLVGKGVCFDTGGLDIKTAGNMLLMKKDMGGAANVLALASLIMAAKLPVRLRVLLPIVENSIGSNAMRPSDIIATRKGLTVEVGNTDAEGRLILCDALCEADSEQPDLLVDCATLTGAARVALGTDVPAFFTHDDALAASLADHAAKQADPMWRLPLVGDYAGKLKSTIADITNDPASGYGGAISAALFLDRFVETCKSWVHIDMMAWNVSAREGRPIGGEAQTIRACFSLIKERYDRR